MNEAQLTTLLRTELEPSFWLMPEAWLRDPLSGIDLRVDFLAWPRADDFPLDVFGVEVKGEDCDGSDFTQALKQCIDYKRAVIVDERAQRSQGLTLGAVFLFRGRQTSAQLTDSHRAHYGAIRLAGKLNVGEAVLHDRHGLRLEVADTEMWSKEKGTTGVGLSWPQLRRVGNSRRRAA